LPVSVLKQVWHILPSELTLGDDLGSGAFGRVCRATWGDLHVAVKALDGHSVGEGSVSVDEFRREVQFMQSIRHANIVLFYGAGTFASGERRSVCITF
jgi:serine/threonine protein kinase